MSQNVPAKENSLTPRQLEALPYLTATSSLSEGTTLADISRRTLHRWLEDDDFREKLQQLRSEAADLARTELQGLMLKSVEVLAGSMDDPDSGVRLRAARATLSMALRAIDFRELAQRLQRLDDAFALWTSQTPKR